jgi:hypothetical protein
VLNVIATNNASSLTGGGLHKHSDAQNYYDSANSAWTGALISYITGGVVLATGTGVLTYQLLQKPAPLPTATVATP